MKERRRDKRHVVTFPVVVESQGRYSFVSKARNAARKGLLVLTAGALEVGERVTIAYRAKGRTVAAEDVEGRIVRLEPNPDETQREWPTLAAIEFSGPLPDIDALLEELEES